MASLAVGRKAGLAELIAIVWAGRDHSRRVARRRAQAERCLW